MKTRFLIIIVIAVIVVSSATTYMMVPVKYVGSSFNSPWLQENLNASKIIRESDIPILGVDVDEKIGVLTIYMTGENSQKYIQEIDDLIDVPFDILSETQSRELQCLKTYKDIREISRTHDAATSKWHIVKHLKYSVGQYVELQCPEFSDLESMKMDLKKYSFVTIPQGAVIEGRTSLIPQEITIILGINNTVTWINEDDVPHGITSDTGVDNLWGTPGVLKPEDLDKFASNLEGEQHMMVLNNPHNPTGIVYSRQELEKITEVCRKHNILVLADEIYALDTYDMKDFTSMGLVYPEGTFITNGLSKDRSAGGYRLGSCIMPENSEKLAKDFKKVAATVYTNVSTPTQYAAIRAYDPNDEIEEYINITRQIHRIMGTYLSARWNQVDGIKATIPQGAFYFFADFNELSADLKRKGVATSNQLADSLISCPHHIGVVTGDANMLDPNDYGARIAFVDYDGKAAFDDYKNNSPKSESDEIEFVKRNSPMMVKSVESLKNWVNYIRSN